MVCMKYRAYYQNNGLFPSVVSRNIPSRWLFPRGSDICPSEMWHSSYRHGKTIWLWITPAEGYQREWNRTGESLDNNQTLACWLWLWQNKTSLLGILQQTWGGISRYGAGFSYSGSDYYSHKSWWTFNTFFLLHHLQQYAFMIALEHKQEFLAARLFL